MAAQSSELAGKLLGAVKLRGEVMEVVRDDGERLSVLVRQPSVGARQRIFKAAKMTGTSPTDLAAMNAQAAIECACDPATGKQLFSVHHLESLLAEPSGGWLDEVARKVMELLSPASKTPACIGCGAAPPAGAKFCGECGLEVPPPAPDPT